MQNVCKFKHRNKHEWGMLTVCWGMWHVPWSWPLLHVIPSLRTVSAVTHQQSLSSRAEMPPEIIFKNNQELTMTSQRSVFGSPHTVLCIELFFIRAPMLVDKSLTTGSGCRAALFCILSKLAGRTSDFQSEAVMWSGGILIGLNAHVSGKMTLNRVHRVIRWKAVC